MAESSSQQNEAKRRSVASMMMPGALSKPRTSVAALAAASAATAAANKQREQAQMVKQRKTTLSELDAEVGDSTTLALGDVLESEIMEEEAMGMFTYLATKTPWMHDFSESDIECLVQLFTILRYEDEQVLVQRGERGTWFGIILSGSIEVHLPTGAIVPVPTGSIIGEMVIWNPNSKRAATMKGASGGGLVAIMLRSAIPI